MFRTTASPRRGFTLLELLVVVTVIGGIMAAVYGVLFGTLNGKRAVEMKVAGARVGPMLLDQVERDIRQLFVSNIDHKKVFSGKNHRINGHDADKIHLVSYTPSTQRVEERNKQVFSAINEIGYVLTQSQNPDFLTLWRREDFFVDEEPLEDGFGIPLYRQILGFNIRYFDRRGKEAKDEDKWESEDESEDRGALPAAIEITLEYEVEPRDHSQSFTQEELAHRRFSARRFITFTEDYAAAMAIRSAAPTPPEDTGNGAPGGKGGGGKGGEGTNTGMGGSVGGGHSTGTGSGGGTSSGSPFGN